MNIINRRGVKKSANDVTKGIRKLFGSPPLLKIKMDPTNNMINNEQKSIRTVINMIMIIKTGLTISIPAIIPTMYPRINSTAKLRRIVISNP